MDLVTLLFGLRGRTNRSKYWLAVLIYILVFIAYMVFVVVVLGGADVDNMFSLAGAGLTVWATGFLLFVVMTWSGFAVGIKRLHDRDKRGWWMLLFWFGPSVLGGLQTMTTNAGLAMVYALASLVIVIWGIVELGFLRGTPGANRYGSDPLGGFSNEPLR